MGESNEEEREVMDTPERSKNSQIAASISKFEDSPVFNFLNSLSPIKPVKSTHITQTINPLTFASLPSVFTSPHISSLRESRFLRRHQLSDPSKPEFSSDDQAKTDTKKSNVEATEQLDEHEHNADEDCSKFVVDFPKGIAEYSCSTSTLILVQEGSQRGLYGNEANMEGVTEVDQYKEGTSCDWDNLISNASDLLIFESPDGTDSYKKSDDRPNEQVVEENELENMSTQPGEENDVIEGPLSNNPDEKLDYEHLSGFYRGMRRRCLVFEMGCARRKHLGENSDGNTSSNESSRCLLPGIGLHLNALASTSKDYKIVGNDSLPSGRLLIGPSLAVNFHPSTTGQVNGVLPCSSSEREVENVEKTVLPVEDVHRVSGYVVNEEINQNSPKKKRRKAEQGGEGEACKRCNCKRSKCLKLYCECFAAGVYCVEPCSCQDCFNKPIHEDTVLATRKQIESRNPLAFAPKVIRGPSDSPLETGDDSSKTPASARHKRGCNCKKSGCLKKYCECYQGGVGCSINCRCEGCKNAFGRKDGVEAEAEEEETDANENSRSDRTFQKITNENELEQITDSVPQTPLRAGRQSTQLPFSSKKKPPRSSFPSIASSASGSHAKQALGKSSFVPPPPKFDKQFETIREDEIPDFLQGGSPVSGVHTSSPNRKRVSPPHGGGMSTGLRSSRKLILQSIPSFPSLTQNQ